MSKEKKIHGNNARVDPRRDIIPMGMNNVITDYGESKTKVYNRLGDDAEFCKKEVDDNKK